MNKSQQKLLQFFIVRRLLTVDEQTDLLTELAGAYLGGYESEFMPFLLNHDLEGFRKLLKESNDKGELLRSELQKQLDGGQK
jgi:hypothetical protein